MTTEKKPRFSIPNGPARNIQYINELRIVAIYAVVTGHVAIWQTMSATPDTFHWFLGCWVHWLCRPCVPVFVMISGALLLEPPRIQTPGEFYRRRLQRIGVPLVFWTVFYLIWRQTFGGEQLSIRSALGLTLTVEPYYHLWFLFMIPGLYLLTPPLRTFLRHAGRSERLLVIAVIFVLAEGHAQANVLFWHRPRLIFTAFLPFVGYYLCGYELRKLDPRTIPLKALLVAVAACFAYVVVMFLVFMDNDDVRSNDFLLHSFSPPVVLMGIGVFWAAYIKSQTHKTLEGIPKTALEWIASTALGIYVLHPAVLDLLQFKLAKHATDANFILGLTLVPFVTYLACNGLVSLAMNVPYLRRTVS